MSRTPTKAQIAAQLDALRVEHHKALGQIEHLNNRIAALTADAPSTPAPTAPTTPRPGVPHQPKRVFEFAPEVDGSYRRALELAKAYGRGAVVQRVQLQG